MPPIVTDQINGTGVIDSFNNRRWFWNSSFSTAEKWVLAPEYVVPDPNGDDDDVHFYLLTIGSTGLVEIALLNQEDAFHADFIARGMITLRATSDGTQYTLTVMGPFSTTTNAGGISRDGLEVSAGQAGIDFYNNVDDPTGSLTIIDFSLDLMQDPTVPGTPDAPTLTTQGTNAITSGWIIPDDGMSPITGQRLQYRRSGQTPEEAWTDVDLGPAVTSHQVTGLMASTSYDFRVRATNSVGDGEYSDIATMATADPPPQPDPPDAPGRPTTTISSGSSITPAWQLPNDGGAAITGQRLQYRESGTDPWTDVDLGADVTSHEVTGLMASTSYDFRVRATNSVGDGDYSDIATATIRPPATPDAPTITHDNSRALTAGWIIPDGNGLPITGQRLQYRETGTPAWTDVDLGAAVTSHQVSGLMPGTSYDFRVAASNAAGIGDYSNIRAVSTVPERPATPAIPTLTVLGENEIRVAYVAPYDGGADISAYILEYREQGTPAWTEILLGGDVLSHTIMNLASDTDYEVRVSARNVAGTSDPSDVATAMTQPPNQMPVLEDIFDQTVAGGAQVMLAVMATDPEGHALTYLWEKVSGPDIVITNADMATATVQAPSLATPSVFVFRVTVTDSQGASASADLRVTVRAVPLAPAAPDEPDVVAVAPTILRTTWNTPADNNSPILSYDARWRRDGTADWFTVTGLPADEVLYYISGLMPDTLYEVEIRAINAIGPGNWSPTGTGRTAMADPLTAPLIAWLADFKDSGHKFWSGENDLTLNGVLYQGRSFISLSTSEASLDAPRRRMTASFPAVDGELRAMLMQDPGPLIVEIRWIYSLDHGQTWLFVPRKFIGRLSTPIIREGTYTIEIETYGGDIDRGRPLRWSDEDQQRRYPGDRGMEFMRALSEGIDTKWPP